MKIAIATCEELPNGFKDETLLKKKLDKKLIATTHLSQVDFKIWNDKNVQWSDYDKVLIRSTWDYHYNIANFFKWIESIEQKTELVNSPQSIIWNARKNYLLEIESRGVKSVPSIFFKDMENADPVLKKQLSIYGKLIIKPTISASSNQTFKIDNLDSGIDAMQSALKKSEGMIQPYIDSIETEGEASLIFFANQSDDQAARYIFSHAILKKPKLGDFRVQHEFGGVEKLFDPTQSLIDFSMKALMSCPGKITYARVDVVDFLSEPKIGEIELIEPDLFLRHHPPSIDLFSKAILNS